MEAELPRGALRLSEKAILKNEVKVWVSDFISMVWQARGRLESGTKPARPIGNRPQDTDLPHVFLDAIISGLPPFVRTHLLHCRLPGGVTYPRDKRPVLRRSPAEEKSA
jgi:hypothetical protein